MEINATNISYALNAGVTDSVSVTLHGSDSNGTYFDGTVKVLSEDLEENKTFGGATQDELIVLAKSKLKGFIK
ncbi:hypothetical protein IV36_GL001764 [Liquorilactobacillus mali]|uniref:Uncharacterized protein n=2 Tax=Liquorilactobacillus mali TaxID=1618 RepID=A0A0R2FTL5_9LACO|nr:hypothetical protein IV36_GL001764 [Liquorilactobacillus mali]